MIKTARTLFDKIWDAHIVSSREGYPDVLYIDTHLIHEVTSPQAFNSIRTKKRSVSRPDKTWATMDHDVPTENQDKPIEDALARDQLEALKKNTTEFNIPLYGLGHEWQGIVHIIGPELGITQPGKTIVCGDSHTSTHGAFGSIAFGIGTSEVEQVLTTQTMLQYRPKRMRITVNGNLKKGVYSKDIILFIISKLKTSGGTGYFVEFAGTTISQMSMEERMTICNMSIEMGARGGMIAPDDITFEYIKNKNFAPKKENWEKALSFWKTLYSDEDAVFDKEYSFRAEDISQMITFGTNPEMAISIDGTIPKYDDLKTDNEKKVLKKALDYMGFSEGQKLEGQPIDYVFLGSCTNGRIEDFRIFAEIVKGKQKAENVIAYIVPGSQKVKKQIENEGLDKIIEDAGFKIRQPGCSACLSMNSDKVPSGKYCLSTSNRNFEGRQGIGSRTILASPATIGASAIAGKIVSVM